MKTLGLVLLLLSRPAFAATPYVIGTPVVEDIWVDPLAGSNGSSGASRATALRTLTEAWNRIPAGRVLEGHGYRIQLVAGTYAEDDIPNYLESRWGTAQFPIIIQSADASRSAQLAGDLNVFDTRYLYLIGLHMRPQPAGDVFHCEQCDHILIRDSRLDGGDFAAHETVKVNQSQHVYLESSTVSGADDNAIDFVAVQYGHVIDNIIYNASDWCVYAKGGSAYLRIEGNEIFQCGTGGFTAGQGTGFQFMAGPWLHYEAYDIKVVNNVIHDIEGAGLGVNGGYNILLAYNTVYRVGSRSHMVEVTFGNRSCDGRPGDEGRERCMQNLDVGGWGTTIVDDGTNYVRIPSRNVWIYNNIFFNNAGYDTGQIFEVPGPWTDSSTQQGSNVPMPARVDDNLQIKGNVIYADGASLGLSDDSGCRPENPTCNPARILVDNYVNVFEPQFVNPNAVDFRPAPGTALTTIHAVPIPNFSWTDAPTVPAVPQGELSNDVRTDRSGLARRTGSTPGAYVDATQAGTTKRRAVRH